MSTLGIMLLLIKLKQGCGIGFFSRRSDPDPDFPLRSDPNSVIFEGRIRIRFYFSQSDPQPWLEVSKDIEVISSSMYNIKRFKRCIREAAKKLLN